MTTFVYQIICYDFDIKRLRRLLIVSDLTLAIFTALHIRNLLNTINIFV